MSSPNTPKLLVTACTQLAARRAVQGYWGRFTYISEPRQLQGISGGTIVAGFGADPEILRMARGRGMEVEDRG